MSEDDVLFGYRLRVFDYAARTSVSQACRVFGIHRSTYYVWKRRVERHGLEILRPRERRRPRLPNQLSPFLDIHGQRFLDQYVYSLFEKVAGNFMVQTRWHGDAYRLNPAKQLAIVVDGFRVEFLSKLKSFGFIAVNNGN